MAARRRRARVLPRRHRDHGGSAIEWLVDLGLLAHARDLDAVAARAPDADGVVCVPALQGLGTPHLDDGASAILLGLTRGSRAEHVVRAVLEGIAQRCADVCEAMALPPGPLRVDGGLARSDAFLAALANALGREIRRAAETETTALGAAYLAGLATGIWRSPDEAVATSRLPVVHRAGARRRRAAREARALAACDRAQPGASSRAES